MHFFAKIYVENLWKNCSIIRPASSWFDQEYFSFRFSSSILAGFLQISMSEKKNTIHTRIGIYDNKVYIFIFTISATFRSSMFLILYCNLLKFKTTQYSSICFLDTQQARPLCRKIKEEYRSLCTHTHMYKHTHTQSYRIWLPLYLSDVFYITIQTMIETFSLTTAFYSIWICLIYTILYELLFWVSALFIYICNNLKRPCKFNGWIEKWISSLAILCMEVIFYSASEFYIAHSGFLVNNLKSIMPRDGLLVVVNPTKISYMFRAYWQGFIFSGKRNNFDYHIILHNLHFTQCLFISF